jgi:hypothetical protein
MPKGSAMGTVLLGESDALQGVVLRKAYLDALASLYVRTILSIYFTLIPCE